MRLKSEFVKNVIYGLNVHKTNLKRLGRFKVRMASILCNQVSPTIFKSLESVTNVIQVDFVPSLIQ